METRTIIRPAKALRVFSLFFISLSLVAWGSGCITKDDSNLLPPVTTTDLLIVQRAKQILSSEAMWNRADDRVYHPDAKIFSLYTALAKAAREVSGTFEHRGGYMEEARFVIGEIAPRKHYDHPLMDFNNDPTTTLAEIQRVLALTETRINKKMRGTDTTGK